MYRLSEQRLSRLVSGGNGSLLAGGLRGLEKESLRVTPDGRIAQTPHPRPFGSALTHPWITTDYSEALLEFITPPEARNADTLGFLDDIHRYVYAHLDDELLWVTSMPCSVASESSIPIADFGRSNSGWMKHVYRRGLAWRYGRTMQIISGVHFNYSCPPAFWEAHAEAEGVDPTDKNFISDRYFDLIRNFQRLGWVIPYLFGSSPALCPSFMGDREHPFRELDSGTLYLPWATSLRMSDVGYKNKNQAGLHISYNNLGEYIRTLNEATETPDPVYQRIGTRANGEWRQLNTNVLQIENEYYGFIRPKNITESGERPSCALHRRGVRYIEVRALDVDPFDPLGVSRESLRFTEIFLLFCLLHDSPLISDTEQAEIDDNQRLVAWRGREPGLTLARHGRTISLREWGTELCRAMEGIAEMLDGEESGTPYRDTLARQRRAFENPDTTPSARVLADMRESGKPFPEFALEQSRKMHAHFRHRPPEPAVEERFRRLAEDSLRQQEEIEAADRISFADFLSQYFSQTT